MSDFDHSSRFPLQWLVDRFVRAPWSRAVGQLRGVLLLRDATEALEVEDYPQAEQVFLQVIGMDATRATRLMAYHGAVVARLRLGRYAEAVRLADDAFVLLTADGPVAALDAEDRAAHAALEEARRFGQWALEHPWAASELRRREVRQREAARQRPEDLVDPEVTPLGRATAWPDSLQAGYRAAVHGLMAAGLVAAAADRLAPARRLLRAALYASRYDRRIERDVCWHLSRIDDELGLSEEAEQHRVRYEQLNDRVRQTLRRLRWTN